VRRDWHHPAGSTLGLETAYVPGACSARACQQKPLPDEPRTMRPRDPPVPCPPTDCGELVQALDDLGVFRAFPDVMPVIDIHSLWPLPDVMHRREAMWLDYA
jgi:hypothetical protein